MTNIFQEFI